MRGGHHIAVAGVTLVACGAFSSCLLDRAGRGETSTSSAGGMTFAECTTDNECDQGPCTIATCVDGTCEATFQPAETPCGEDLVCDAMGLCKRPLTKACSVGSECHSGFCAEGVCCTSSCEGTCVSCATGQCSMFEVGTDPDDECAGDGICDGDGGCAIGTHIWTRDYGSTSSMTAPIVAAHPDGGSVLAMHFRGMFNELGMTFSASGTDILLVKLSPAGLPEWQEHLNGTDDQTLTALAVDADGNIFGAGYFEDAIGMFTDVMFTADGNNPDGFLFKVDASGTHQWSQHFRGMGTTETLTMSLTSIGVVVAGRYTGQMFIDDVEYPINSQSGFDLWSATYSTAGTFIEAFVPEAVGDEEARGVAVAPNDAMIAVGVFDEELATFVADGRDGFATFTDAMAVAVKTEIITGTGTQSAVAATSLGQGWAIAGFYNEEAMFSGALLTVTNPAPNEPDTFVAAYDAVGALQWHHGYAGDGAQRIHQLASDAGGRLIMVGSYEENLDVGGGPLPSAPTTPTSERGFVARLTNAGEHLWSFGDGGTAATSVTSVSVDADGNVMFAGTMGNGTSTLAGADVTNSGQNERVFVTKIAP